VAILLACRSRGEAPPDAAPANRCDAQTTCAAGAYCTYAPRLCGKGKRPGTCAPKPTACDGAPYEPVCGCDRNAYPSPCAAAAAGVDLAVNGGCAAKIPDYVPCGARFCPARTTYCEIVLSDVFELPTDYTCRPLPTACLSDGGALPACECFPAGTKCKSFCGPIETGGAPGFHLTCRS
jgi:hypothetical protein